MNRDIYQKETQAKFDAWKAELDSMKAGIDKLQAEARQDFYALVNKLDDSWQAAVGQFDDLRASGDDVWDRMQGKVDDAMYRLDLSFADARESFRSSGIRISDPRSEGWPEGQGKILGESEGWTEGLGETVKNTQGWVKGQGEKVKDSAGWPEGQLDR